MKRAVATTLTICLFAFWSMPCCRRMCISFGSLFYEYYIACESMDKSMFVGGGASYYLLLLLKYIFQLTLLLSDIVFVYYNFTITDIWCINIRENRRQNWTEGNSYFNPRVCKVPCSFFFLSSLLYVECWGFKSCKSSLIQL